MKARYFLVNYAAYMDNGDLFQGLATVITEGKFVNQKRFKKDVKEEGADNEQNIKSVLIGNITELTESDYLDWHE